MDDLISKQAVLDAIDAYKYLDGNDAIYRLKQWLNEQESVQPKMGRWIPVSERLPEDKCKTYLVCSDDGYIATIMYDGNGRWLIDDCKIIAWMPLPTAWKGEDQMGYSQYFILNLFVANDTHSATETNSTR